MRVRRAPWVGRTTSVRVAGTTHSALYWLLLSVRSAAADDRADGACQDAQVEEHREILDVEEVEPGVQVQRQLTAAVHLPPSRHAGWDHVPRVLPRLVPLHDPRQLRSWPHQAHLPPQHVDELGQLVQTGPA